jgi:hypothetical protein
MRRSIILVVWNHDLNDFLMGCDFGRVDPLRPDGLLRDPPNPPQKYD